MDELAAIIRQLPEQTFWIGVSVVSGLAIFCLYSSYRIFWRLRIMQDMPTSALRSAAQGYNEFSGVAKLLPGEPIVAPLSRLQCVWYQYKVEERQSSYTRERSQTSWSLYESGVSDGVFNLVGATGRAIVDPDDAEVIPSHSDSWYGSTPYPQAGPRGFNPTGWLPGRRYRYNEKRIHEGDELYVLGNLTSFKEVLLPTGNEALAELLQRWKNNPQVLLDRFDDNKDGLLDEAEWEKAVLIAKEQLSKERFVESVGYTDNLIEKPQNGRKPYIISTQNEDVLARRFKYKWWGFLLAFFALGVAVVWSLNLRI
ncbi:MAG: hypothetical protein COB26_05125 [Piscirickettsiaceae bacterium]|nr:MAG: hypothetical protein COB89_04240 [Piscirickettsiaceae bacterium]PCI70042.1 MAG: hypothetical protein COB26_05125 [Piscirickettsiaceae bacterium]